MDKKNGNIANQVEDFKAGINDIVQCFFTMTFGPQEIKDDLLHEVFGMFMVSPVFEQKDFTETVTMIKEVCRLVQACEKLSTLFTPGEESPVSSEIAQRLINSIKA